MNDLQTWVGYPTCGCLCQKQATCNQNQTFFSPTCSCICKNSVACPNPRHIQDPQTCECACSTIICRNPAQVQDPKTCECSCKKSDCLPGFYQDAITCQCIRTQCWPPLICPDIPIECPNSPCPYKRQRVNYASCMCESMGSSLVWFSQVVIALKGDKIWFKIKNSLNFYIPIISNIHRETGKN